MYDSPRPDLERVSRRDAAARGSATAVRASRREWTSRAADTVTVAIADDLPDVVVPPHGLTQAILNLLVNAGKAVGETGRVMLWARRLADDRGLIDGLRNCCRPPAPIA